MGMWGYVLRQHLTGILKQEIQLLITALLCLLHLIMMINGQIVVSSLRTRAAFGPSTTVSNAQRRLKASGRCDISFCAVKCHCSGNTSKLPKLLRWNYSLVFPHLPLRADPLVHLPVLVTSMSFLFCVISPLFLQPHLPHLFSFITSPTITSFSSDCSLFSSFSFHYHSHLSRSSPFSPLFNLNLFTFIPPSLCPLLLPSLAGPSAEWSYCCLPLSPSLSGQHFRDLLIGLELSIPSGWITEHRCKSPPVWEVCHS